MKQVKSFYDAIKFFSVLLALLLLSSCTRGAPRMLPGMLSAELNPEQKEAVRQNCSGVFVAGDWQLVHSITFNMDLGRGTTVLGVTVLSGATVKTGLMTVEGFVLFEAELDAAGQLEVARALPPFDNRNFAQGLMRDVKTLFLEPVAVPVVAALGREGMGCRYDVAAEGTVDLIPIPGGSFVMHVYDREFTETLSIELKSFVTQDSGMFPEKIYLRAPGIRGYTLKMTLISAEKI